MTTSRQARHCRDYDSVGPGFLGWCRGAVPEADKFLAEKALMLNWHENGLISQVISKSSFGIRGWPLEL